MKTMMLLKQLMIKDYAGLRKRPYENLSKSNGNMALRSYPSLMMTNLNKIFKKFYRLNIDQQHKKTCACVCVVRCFNDFPVIYKPSNGLTLSCSCFTVNKCYVQYALLQWISQQISSPCKSFIRRHA